MKKFGFTGTRRGMTPAQVNTLRHQLSRFQGEFHHGLCVGADEQAHRIAKDLGYSIVGHPPNRSILVMEYDPTDFYAMYPQLPYLRRNMDIVRGSDKLYAAPGGFDEEQRSGTWSTIRFARRERKPVVIIYPDGTRTVV